MGQFERPLSGAGLHRRLLGASERSQQFVYIPVESPVELAVHIVEVSGLPYPGGLVAGGLERVPAYGVLHEHASRCAVDLQRVSPSVSVGRVVRADQTADRPVGEAQGERERAVPATSYICHLGHDGFDPSAQVLQHVEAVALGLYEVGVGMGGIGWFASETPRGEDYLAQQTLLYRFPRHPHGPGVAVVEVDGEKQAAAGGLV